uniref:Uncharacterized protein n=1 Tax=Sphaerodactylus townsendi TaxID=933632 RepID=A0ACB8EQB5_9SAUR
MPRGRRKQHPGDVARGQTVLSKFFLPSPSAVSTSAPPAEALVSSEERSRGDSAAPASLCPELEPVGKRRRTVKNKDQHSKNLQCRQKQEGAGEQKKCANPRICSETFLKLREFSSHLEQPSHRIHSEVSHGSQFVNLEKGQQSDIGNTGILYSQNVDKEEACLQFNQFSLSDTNCENIQNTSDSILNKRTKCIYTPLELQYLEVKNQHKDVILCVECGYKYRFFGEDAEVAAKELNIYCHQNHNFMTASIPTHRLFVHVRRLVAKGYKVGVVKQMETAALKAVGDNKSSLFTRKLTALCESFTEPLIIVLMLRQYHHDACGYYLSVICESKESLREKRQNTTTGSSGCPA